MPAEAPPAPDAPLTIEQAAGLIGAPATEAVEPEEEAQPSEAEPTAEEEPRTEEATEEPTEEEPDPAEPAIAPPQSWDADARAVFATLPREAQQTIAARETERDQAVSRAQTEAAETRKRAEADVQSVTQLRAATEQVLTKAAGLFKGKWDNVDWTAWAQTDPAAYVAGKAQFEAEQGELARMQSVHQAQQAVEMRQFQERKAERIKTLAPELVDPVKGKANVEALETFLVGLGVDRNIFHTLDADVIALANDGFKYRQAQKGLAAKPTPAPARPAVRPAATPQMRSPQRAVQEATNRFRQTGTIEDAVAALNARSG